jgi:glycosyltransferase involved in cell wall biosynthesis
VSTEGRRVLFVLEYFHPRVGGVETLFDELSAALAARGLDVTVLTSAAPGSPATEVRRGVRIVRVPVPRRGARYFFTLRAIATVLRMAKDVDLVHTTTYNAAIPAWIGARLRRRPAVITVHEVYAEQWNQLLGLNRFAGYGYRAFEWAVLHLPFEAYFCDSEHTLRRLRDRMGVDEERLSVVYPAVDYGFWEARRDEVDVRARFGLDADAFVVCSFGRPGVAKGLEYLIDAMADVRRRRSDVALLMLLSRDPPAQHRRLLERIRSHGLDGAVRVVDPVSRDELPSVLRSVDGVVVPSVSEGFGYAAVEAALVGVPVIATSGHSVSEVLPDAVFVPPRDPARLADAIVALADAPPAPPKPAARYDVDRQVRATLDGYEALDATKRRLASRARRAR